MTFEGAMVKRGVVDALASGIKPASSVPSGASDRSAKAAARHHHTGKKNDRAAAVLRDFLKSAKAAARHHIRDRN